MKTTPDIKSYIKDTQQNILERDSSESGIWAFASDTGSIFVSQDGGWLEYASHNSKGTSTLSVNDETINIPHGLIAHLDAKQTDTRRSTANTPIENQAAVGGWDSTSQAILNVQADRTSMAPTYLSNGLGSNRPGIQFKRTALVSPMEQNIHTYTGNFTVFMVLKFEPIWLNGDVYRVGYKVDDDHTGGTNQLIGTPPTHFGLYSSADNGGSGADPLTIGASLENSYATNYWNYMRFKNALGGANSVTATTTDTLFAPQYNSDTGAGVGNEDSQVHANLRNVGLNMGDRMIFTWQYTSADRMSRGDMSVSVAGKAGTYGWSGSYGGAGDYVLRGLKVGGNPHQVDGGWFTLGEMLVFDDNMGTNYLNQVGDYLSTKWSATWIDFE